MTPLDTGKKHMAYAVKEIFHTLQGEGFHTGRAAVFCRFSGCNLWTGREEDRQQAICRFCDTDFRGTDGPGGGRFDSADELALAILSVWRDATAKSRETPFLVCTGGEPLLQLDKPLIEALHAGGVFVAIETNGTQAAPSGIDWICVSPKQGADLVQTSGDELKLVFPQRDLEPEKLGHLEFTHFFLQPMDGPDAEQNTKLAADYCRRNPHWKLSLQTHKYLNIP